MRLIRGAPGSGKTALVFREFKAALQSGGTNPPRIVVPTATLVRHFQHELARDGVVFPPDAVISLSRFIAERAPHLKPAPEGLPQAIVRNALHRLALPEFEAVATTDGMVATILETIALFENAGATPHRLAAARKLSPHARAFLKIWTTLDDSLADRGFSPHPAIVRAAAAATSHAGPIWMDGFIHLSPLERELVAALAASTNLNLTLTHALGADDLYRFALTLQASDRLLPNAASTRKPPVTAIPAPTMEREADEIARRILALHRTGTPFREIGVAMREAGPYLPLLRATLERFGIPARFYFSPPLRTHPAALFLNGLIHCVLNNWEFSLALDTLRAHPAWGRSAAFDRFDFTVREATPGAGPDHLLALARDLDDGGRFAQRLEPCLALDSWKTLRLTAPAWQSRCEALVADLYRPSPLPPPRDHRALETVRTHPAALRAWNKAIAAAAAFWPATHELTLAEFWSVAAETIDAATLRANDDSRDVVHVMSVYEARQWDLSALFLCGMTDRDYPRRTPQNLLFPDPDIEALRKSGIPLRPASDRDREEDALFEALRTRARDSLTLTWPTHDAAGRAVESSRYIDTPSTPPVPCVAEPALSLPAAAFPGRVDSPALLTALADHHRKISITGLEDLAQCRFKFFAARTLSLRTPPLPPQKRLDPRVSGLIMHEALEAWLLTNRVEDFAQVFEIAFTKACEEKNLPPGFRLEVEHIELRDIARRVKATELWEAQSEAEVELTLDFPRGITVSARVDRIDRLPPTEEHPADCIVVDYKSGKTERVAQFTDSKVRLQGPLYALAARENLQLNAVAVMYHGIREDKRFGWGAVPGLAPGVDLGLIPMPPNWMEDAKTRAVDRIDSLLSGDVHPEPVDPELCVWCDYAHACRFRAGQAEEVATADGALAHGG